LYCGRFIIYRHADIPAADGRNRTLQVYLVGCIEKGAGIPSPLPEAKGLAPPVAVAHTAPVVLQYQMTPPFITGSMTSSGNDCHTLNTCCKIIFLFA